MKEKTKWILKKVMVVCGITVSILLGFILCMNLVLITRGFSDSGHVPSIFGYTPLIVKSGSMEPAIMTGDLILVKQSSANEIHADEDSGDIIAFYSGNSIVTHRAVDLIYEEEDLYIQTKGDANNIADGKQVAADEVIGTYAVRFPYLGDAIFFLQTTAGMVFLVLIPVAGICLYELIKAGKRQKADQKVMERLKSELENLQTTNHNES